MCLLLGCEDYYFDELTPAQCLFHHPLAAARAGRYTQATPELVPDGLLPMNRVTRLLSAFEKGDPKAAGELLPLVYEELRRLAARKIAHETPGQSLSATALVHEAYLRLVDTKKIQQWNSRGHFFGAAAEAMRRILIERARHKRSLKAGGDRRRQDLNEIELAVEGPDTDLLVLDEALENLERKDPRAAALIKLRFFAGLTIDQAAQALGVSTSTAESDWAYARCWLRLEVEGGESNDAS